MASVKFNEAYVIAKANAAITIINLGIPQGSTIANETTSSEPLSGSSEQVIVTYKNNTPPPRVYKVSKEVTFAKGAHVTITGGGESENTVGASDSVGNKGEWLIVGR